MLLELSSDQEFFRETTARFLESRVPVDELRRLRDNVAGFDADYWRRGAELGWTSLLVGEEHGGGTIGGAGLVDLTLVAHEFGAPRRAGAARADQRRRRGAERGRRRRAQRTSSTACWPARRSRRGASASRPRTTVSAAWPSTCRSTAATSCSTA